MVQQNRHVVAFVDIFTHSTSFLLSLRRSKLRGIKPPEIKDEFATPEVEEVTIEISGEGDRLEKGVIKFRAFDVPRFQLVADVLGKSVVLSHYEAQVGATFESIEPFAQRLSMGHRTRNEKELLKTTGNILLIEHRTVGMAEVGDKPESLWERPDLERLYARLEDEYEIRERQAALERKLSVITRTAETVVNLLQHQSGMRVEWYIVILIVFEIGLTLFEMFVRGH